MSFDSDADADSNETADTLTVNGVTVRITPYGLDKRGRAHFELAGYAASGRTRDVFPTDRGYINNGQVYMLTPTTAPAPSAEWVWTHIGAAMSGGDGND